MTKTDIKIEPRIIDGEPYCTAECPRFTSPERHRDCVFNYCKLCVTGLQRQRDDAMQQRDEWRKALQSLTPQGSDDGEPLCETPAECATYIRGLKRELEKFRRMQDSGMVLDI
jgi:hypothetical protein